VNISVKLPYLQGVDADQQESVIAAVDLLQMIRGSRRLGFQDLGMKDLTVREFNLLTYLSAEVDKHG
jgi:tartrate dehydratase beta subunit/fumarate hydratase class I family protein